ncbi:DUF6232 family protein [Micromonospora sp. NPDC093277]|uniref:DUF6232 family protein n=1 Tax=Micromonospora sp. NPDC093277 TaxID=3364291 RepID=UPI0038106206
MITYYEDRSVQVTSTAVRVDGRTYPLAELGMVWHRRGDRSWRVLAGRGAIGAALAGPLVAAALGVGLALRLGLSPVLTVALVGASVLVGLGAGPLADVLFERLDRSYARGSRELEMWARWRGQPVRLLRTGDALRFGQIYRAVQRAMETAPPPGRHATGTSGDRPGPRSRP